MEKTLKDCYIIILAGGGGTRLWPKSRTRKPKQFLRLSGKNTLFTETVRRVAPLVSLKNIFVITSELYIPEVQSQIPDFPLENIIGEPQPKSTAAAVALGLVHILKINPKAVVASIHSDHLIQKTSEFRKVLTSAFKAAKQEDLIVTIGIHPKNPDTGLGYIHSGKKLFEVDKKPVFKVESFTEKPDLTTAEAFLAAKEYFWNGGYFIAQAEVFLRAFKKHMPKLYQSLEKVRDVLGKPEEKEVMAKIWSDLENISIDYGIMEKTKNIVMVPGDFGWSDIGNWSVLHEVSAPLLEGNVVIGDEEGRHLGLDTKGCLIHSNGRLIATIGLSDMVIIDTLDALLICPKDKVQEVRKIVELLKKEKRHEYL